MKTLIKSMLSIIILFWALFLLTVPAYAGDIGHGADDASGPINWVAWIIFIAIVVLCERNNN